jgi:NADH pyrophosphatase NudC (nudix superfamily)
MGLDPHLAGLVVVTSCVGLCMALAGVGKNALEWRRRERSCPSCGRRLRDCCCCR